MSDEMLSLLSSMRSFCRTSPVCRWGRIGLALSLGVSACDAWGCRIPSYDYRSILPPQPMWLAPDHLDIGIERIEYSVKRGTGPDPITNISTSCDFLGRIRILVFSSEVRESSYRVRGAKGSFGYAFELVKSNIGPDPIDFPQHALRSSPSTDDAAFLYHFAWNDGAYRWQEPLELKIRITGVDRWGRSSEPCLLTVRHPGGESTREWGPSVTARCE